MNSKFGAASFTAVALGAAMSFGSVQTASAADISASEFLVFLEALGQGGQPAKHLSLFGIQSATTAPHGMVFTGVTGTNPRGGVPGAGMDYDVALGFGLGDATETLGLQFTANITGTDPFGDAGYLSMKLSRALNERTYAALSFSQLGAWGGAAPAGESANFVVTHFNEVSIGNDVFPIMLSAGYGSHITNNGTDPGGYIGVGMGLSPYMGVSLSANEEQVNVGIGLKIPQYDRWSISLGVNDVADNTGRQSASMTITYAVQNVFGGFK